jgi:hypothetical protein
VRIHTTHTRDAALRELNRVTRWLIAASVVLTGVLSGVAASAFSGKRVEHGVRSRPNSARAHTTSTHTNTSTSPLRPPTHAPKASVEGSSSSHEAAPAQEPAHESAPEPAPSQESAPVVSGGS